MRLALISDRRFLKRRYKREIGVLLDLEEPTRFTALLNWRKLFDRNPLYTECSDKLAVRSYVQERAGRGVLIPLLASGEKWSDLNYAALDEPFIIKTTHGQGGNRIVLDKSGEDESELQWFFARHMRRSHYSGLREWQYRDIRPTLVAERLLLDEDGRIPPDYKLHCFHTEEGPEIFVYVIARHGNKKQGAVFDLAWNQLPFKIEGIDVPDVLPPRPTFLPELVRVAKSLAAGFTYVRVDLYWSRGQVFFGELTFSPSSGLSRIVPDEWDFILGEKLRRTGILERNGVS